MTAAPVPLRPAVARRTLPHNSDAEASILGGILLRNEVLSHLDTLEVEDFFDPKHKIVFHAIRNLEAAGRPIDVVTLENEIAKAGKLEAIGGLAFLGELTLRVPTADNVVAYAEIVTDKHRARKLILASSEITEKGFEPELEVRDYLDDAEARILEVTKRRDQRSTWRRARDYVEEIADRASEPQWPLTLGGDELVTIAAGEIVVLVAAAKRGKTSLALGLAIEHARDRGPAIVASLELRGRVLVARAIGSRCESSWRGVLRGEVQTDDARSALPERLAVIDRDDVTTKTIESAIEDLRREHPGEPILLVIDYLQLVESDQREIRARVDDAMRQIDRVAQSRAVGVLALSQSSRAASRQLASGERIGAEAADAGAESAAIERWASAVVAIGAVGEPADDGTAAAELSIAAQRYERGDRVMPARYDGRTGRWRLTGDSRPAADVRAERGAERDSAKQQAAELAIVAAAERAAEPQTRESLIAAGSPTQRALGRAAMAAVLARGELVEVDRRRPRSRNRLVWSRSKAEAAGIPVVGDDGE